MSPSDPNETPPEETSLASEKTPILTPPGEENRAPPDPPLISASEAEPSVIPPPASPIASVQAHKTQTGPMLPSGQDDARKDQPDEPTGSSSSNGGDEPPIAASSSLQAGSIPTTDLTGSILQEATLASWAGLNDEERIACYKAIDLYFHNLLEDFRTSANEAVVSYSRFGILGNRWRIWLISLTGGLAVLNVLATSWPDQLTLHGSNMKGIFSFFAAIYAVVLALLTNIESFCNFSDKKTSTRESRELYLDAYREFEMMRLTHVYPYGYSAQACVNFVEIYRRLVLKDLELRRKIMQLSTTRTGEGRD